MKIIKIIIIVFVFLLLFPLIISLFGEDKPKKTENDIEEKIQVYASSSSKKYTFEEINENEFSLIENFDEDENISFFVNEKIIEKTNFNIIGPTSCFILNDDNSITPTSINVYEITYRLEDNILRFEPLGTQTINNEVFYCEKNPTSLANGYWQFTNNINFNTGGSLGCCAIDSLGNFYKDISYSGNLLYGELPSGERLYFIGSYTDYDYLAINEDGSFKSDYFIRFYGESYILSKLINSGAKKFISLEYKSVNFDKYSIEDNPTSLTGGYWKLKENFIFISDCIFDVDFYDFHGNHFNRLEFRNDEIVNGLSCDKFLGIFDYNGNSFENNIVYTRIDHNGRLQGLGCYDGVINNDYYFYFNSESSDALIIEYINSIADKYVLNDGGNTNE